MRRFFISFFTFFIFSISFATEKSQIKFVVFDFGEVIVTTNIQELRKFVSDSLSISIDEATDTLNSWYSSTKEGMEFEAFWTAYAKATNRTLPTDWALKFKSAVRNSISEIPGMLDLVKSLQEQGYQTPLLSNTLPLYADVANELGLYGYFHPVLLSCQIGAKKPQAQAYQILLERLNTTPSTCLFIDDNEKNILSARELGIEGIQFISLSQLKEKLRAYLCIHQM